jgi:hypothetical protein
VDPARLAIKLETDETVVQLVRQDMGLIGVIAGQIPRHEVSNIWDIIFDFCTRNAFNTGFSVNIGWLPKASCRQLAALNPAVYRHVPQ